MSKIDHFLRPPQKLRMKMTSKIRRTLKRKMTVNGKVILPKDGRYPEGVCNLYGKYLKNEK